MFVMTQEEVDHTPAARLAMYANIVVVYWAQKTTPTKFKSQQVATLSITLGNQWRGQWIL
jgi:hypothetical protein